MTLVKRNLVIKITNTQPVFTCPKSVTETPEQGPNHGQPRPKPTIHIYTYIYITANPEHILHTAPGPPSPTPKMWLPAGYFQLKLILKSYQNVISNSNIQRNDIIEKSFTHCTIDVMPLVILVCNEKLLSSWPTKTNINKRGFSQT